MAAGSSLALAPPESDMAETQQHSSLNISCQRNLLAYNFNFLNCLRVVLDNKNEHPAQNQYYANIFFIN